MNTNTDSVVLELFNRVRTQQKEIAKDSGKPRWETSCTIGLNDNITTNVNIQTVSDQNKLVDLYAFLLIKEDYYVKAGEQLGIKANLKWQGYSFDSWKRDFKTRMAAINLAAKKEELKVLEGRLSKLISPEQWRELELAEIQREMGL